MQVSQVVITSADCAQACLQVISPDALHGQPGSWQRHRAPVHSWVCTAGNSIQKGARPVGSRRAHGTSTLKASVSCWAMACRQVLPAACLTMIYKPRHDIRPNA